MKSLSRLLLSVAFLLAFAFLAMPMLASAAEAWPDAPTTITDANADFDQAAFRGFDAVYKMQPGELQAPSVHLASTERTPARNPRGSTITSLRPAPFDAVADWRAKRKLWA